VFIDELAVYSQWVVTYVVDKIPLNPRTGLKAAVDDPSTWTDYATAQACCACNRFLTLGFVLTPNDPFVCIDLDTHRTLNSEIISLHQRIYEKFNSYAELSPSGGVHVWVKGSLAQGKKESKLFYEVYPNSRYITVTGNALNELPIRNGSETQQLLDEMCPVVDKIINQGEDSPETQTDQQIIETAAYASNGELFQALYLGKWQGRGYPTQSEADLALINIIGFYTDNKNQVARIYYSSNLFQNTPDPKKKKRKAKPDYLFHPNYGLVTKAFDQKYPTQYFPELEAIVKLKVQEEAKSALTPLFNSEPGDMVKQQLIQQLPEFVKKELFDFSYDELPPGLVGEIAKFIFQNAIRPVKEIAISAAIAYLAGICGKGWNVSKTGLNHYVVILAPTAGGKEGAASGMEQLTKYICEKFEAFDQFIGPADIASPQALIKHLATASPCFLSHKGEVGFWMQKLTAKYAKANETQLRAVLLELYTKSGQGQVIRGSIYSDKSKDVKPIKAPAFSLYGDATPDTFYKALDEENVEEGLVARFTVIEATGARTEFNELHDSIPPNPLLIDKLAALGRRAMQLAQIESPVEVQETPDAKESHMQFMQECYEKAFTDRDSAEGKLYSRAHLRLLRLAALIAVGINPDNPVITADIVRWSRAFIVQGIAAVSARFEAGRIGEINYTLEQRLIMIKVLKNYWMSHYQKAYETNYAINEEMFNMKIVTNRYLQANVRGAIGFRKDRNPLLAYKNMIQEFIDNGILEKIEMGKIKDSARRGLAYYIKDIDSLTVK
jgi:hypothetical protein